MKSHFILVVASFLLVSTSQADWRWDKDKQRGAKSSMVEQRVTSPSYCFDTGFVFSGFGSGFWPDDSGIDNAIGGGISLAYFLGRNFGIEGSYAAHGSSESQQVGTFNAVYRIPLGGECCSTIAPYVFGGPGVLSAGSSKFLWNVGGGIDWRFEGWGCIGLFADFSYNWVVQEPVPDFTMIRTGFRVPF